MPWSRAAMSSLPAGTLITGVFAGRRRYGGVPGHPGGPDDHLPAPAAPTYGDPPVDVAPTDDSGLAPHQHRIRLVLPAPCPTFLDRRRDVHPHLDPAR